MAKSNYYDNFNPDLLNEIPNNIPKILELGCGAGALGAKYKSLNPSSHWCGLELIEEQANSARNKLDRVICTDIETNSPIKPDEQFDALIVGDVLEHLKDPWSVLRDLVACIKPNGFICICIPNVGHWSVVANLIAGNFKYEDSGILDRTHLRFFTGSSMIELLTQSNIEIKKILPRRIVLNEHQYTKFCESMIPFCNEFGVEFEHIKDRSSVFQYIFSGHKISTV